MKIYQTVTSPFAFRVRIAVYVKDIPVGFAVAPGGVGSQEYRKVSPFGKVPCLVCDDGTAIAESAVINEYLEQQFFEPLLLPAAATDRARSDGGANDRGVRVCPLPALVRDR